MQVGVVVKGEIAGSAQSDLRRHANHVCLIARSIVSSESSSAVSACLGQIMDFSHHVADIDARKNIAAVTSDRNDIGEIAG